MSHGFEAGPQERRSFIDLEGDDASRDRQSSEVNRRSCDIGTLHEHGLGDRENRCKQWCIFISPADPRSERSATGEKEADVQTPGAPKRAMIPPPKLFRAFESAVEGGPAALATRSAQPNLTPSFRRRPNFAVMHNTA